MEIIAYTDANALMNFVMQRLAVSVENVSFNIEFHESLKRGFPCKREICFIFFKTVITIA